MQMFRDVYCVSEKYTVLFFTTHKTLSMLS